MKNFFISGVSTGIGCALAERLLARGERVYGVSRRAPAALLAHPNFHFCQVDFSDSAAAAIALRDFIAAQGIAQLATVFLNVGQFGKRIAPVSKVDLADLEEMMRVNVWSHKLLLDILLERDVAIDCAFFSSSIAGVRARAGNSGYAITKAALNMLATLYSLENPGLRVLLLGLCNVDTFLSRTIGSLPLEGQFPDIVSLRERARGTSYMVTAQQRADDVLGLLEPGRIDTIPRGQFVEIRQLLSPSTSL